MLDLGLKLMQSHGANGYLSKDLLTLVLAFEQASFKAGM